MNANTFGLDITLEIIKGLAMPIVNTGAMNEEMVVGFPKGCYAILTRKEGIPVVYRNLQNLRVNEEHIKIRFKEDIGVRRSQLQILISDDRNPDRCEKLIAFLPEDFVAPEWIQAARKRRGH